jgi:uncharacterized protein
MSIVDNAVEQSVDAKCNVIFVVKISKLCNLRCRYCYEFSQLSNPRRMSFEQLSRFFTSLDGYYGALSHDVRIRFVWHGGEPLLVPPDYYWRLFELQRQIFRGRIEIKNSVQTNLIRLDNARLRLLKNGFDTVGVSIDLFGDLRVDVRGAQRQEAVLENMERLREAGIPFGCITVLTRHNLPYLPNIYSFYEQLGLDFRLLPLFPGETDDQHRGYEITAAETLDAYKQIVDLIFERDPIIRVEPLATYVRAALLFLSRPTRPNIYRRTEWERYFIIDTDGAAYSNSSVYDPEEVYGNVFETPLAEILSSRGRQRSIAAADERVAAECWQCQYFGACDGEPVADRLSEFPDMYLSGKRRCIVEKGLIAYIVDKLREARVVDDAGALVGL